ACYPDAWVFPSAKGAKPLGRDNTWRGLIAPRLKTIQLNWATFQIGAAGPGNFQFVEQCCQVFGLQQANLSEGRSMRPLGDRSPNSWCTRHDRYRLHKRHVFHRAGATEGTGRKSGIVTGATAGCSIAFRCADLLSGVSEWCSNEPLQRGNFSVPC